MQTKTNTWIPNYQICENCFSKVISYEGFNESYMYCSNLNCINHKPSWTTNPESVDWTINADPENIKSILKKLDTEIKFHLEIVLLDSHRINFICRELEVLKANALAGDVNLIKMFYLWNKKQDRAEANQQLCDMLFSLQS